MYIQYIRSLPQQSAYMYIVFDRDELKCKKGHICQHAKSFFFMHAGCSKKAHSNVSRAWEFALLSTSFVSAQSLCSSRRLANVHFSYHKWIRRVNSRYLWIYSRHTTSLETYSRDDMHDGNVLQFSQKTVVKQINIVFDVYWCFLLNEN